jgi:uncharacterized membrane protein
MNEAAGFSLLFAAVGALFIGLGMPLLLGRVPPNHVYGCRTKQTLADPSVWYEANRAAGKDFSIAGLIILTASLAALAFGRDSDADHVVFILISVLMLCVAAACRRCFKAGGRR